MEEALVEMLLAGGSVKIVEDIIEVLWGGIPGTVSRNKCKDLQNNRGLED